MIISGVEEVDLLPLIICQGFKSNLFHDHKNYLYWSKNSDLIRLFEIYFVQFDKNMCCKKPLKHVTHIFYELHNILTN